MSLMKELFPPDVPPIARWRLAHFALGVIMTVFMMWALGLFAAIGFPGFAKAADIQSVQRDVKEINLSLLEQRIYEAQRLQCSASNAEAQKFYDGQVKKMHREYREASGILLPVPDCRHLGSREEGDV